MLPKGVLSERQKIIEAIIPTIIVAIDKITVASLRYEKAELLRSHLKELLAGRGTEFADSGAVEDPLSTPVP